MSVEFYDRNAEAFFSSTVALEMGAIRARFLDHVPAGGAILDAGCGSGRDALAFHQAGYAVTAFDASAQLVGLARDYTGLPVGVLSFADMAWEAQFDGIWASASLLHVPRLELPGVVAALARALRPAGVLYVSMKRGQQDREVEGRLFVDVDEQELAGTSDYWRDPRPSRSSR